MLVGIVGRQTAAYAAYGIGRMTAFNENPNYLSYVMGVGALIAFVNLIQSFGKKRYVLSAGWGLVLHYS
jgi:hypothetical protein